MPMDRTLMVKQFCGEIHTPTAHFRVFQSGDDKFFVFDPIDQYGCSYCNAFAVRKSDLKPEIRAGLNKGYSMTRRELTDEERMRGA